MSSLPATVAEFAFARLVPELLVNDVNASLRFWRDLCGFRVAFDRLYEGFAYLDLDGAQIMLEERGRSRNWVTGPMDVPFGRGVNFQIEVPAIEPILASLDAAGWPLFMPPEQKWYRTGEVESGVHQFLVQDPDGYLIRFSAGLGRRHAPPIGARTDIAAHAGSPDSPARPWTPAPEADPPTGGTACPEPLPATGPTTTTGASAPPVPTERQPRSPPATARSATWPGAAAAASRVRASWRAT